MDKQTKKFGKLALVMMILGLSMAVSVNYFIKSANGATTAPLGVTSASSDSNTTVDLVFNQPVDPTTAQISANYSVSPGLAVNSAALQDDGVTVKLVTSSQQAGTSYTITVNNVKDLNSNIIAGKNSAVFQGTAVDSNPPTLISTTAVNNTKINLVFSKTMDQTSTQAIGNYAISPGLNITSATLGPDGSTVTLMTAPQTVSSIYTVTVSNITDSTGIAISGSGNKSTFTGATNSDNPHAKVLSNTDKCAVCHLTHTSIGPFLNIRTTQMQLCYLCHDAAGQSIYDVADTFGQPNPQPSHHKVPEGTQLCTDCHNPHGGSDAAGNPWPRMLQSSADTTKHSGNQFCFSCHQNNQGTTPAIDTTNYPAAGVGHNNETYTINGTTPFKPSSGTNISCSGCHQDHGSGISKLLKPNPANGTTPATTDDKNFCVNCHQNNSPNNRFPGASVFNNSKHSLTTSTNTNVNFPGMSGQAGQCANCHDPHGTSNGTSQESMKTLRASYTDIPLTSTNKGTINYTADNFSFCFKCHNNTSANKNYDIQTPYTAGGHNIKTAGGNLAVGSKIPCEDCHSLHGSANNNKYSLSDSLGSDLGNGRNECVVCHTAGKVVEGLTMSDLTSSVPEHSSTNTTTCLTCHGSSHEPSPGLSQGGLDCSSCHSTVVVAMKSTTSGNHHLMNNSSATYSTTQSGNQNCLSCHVDHNKFNGNKAANLKTNYLQSFTTVDNTPGVNTDFISSDAYGGICLSCHTSKQVKGYTQSNGSTATEPISISNYTTSAHNYNATSTFNDGTTFDANCSKCHNDDMTKDKQTSTIKFSTHNSSYESILTPFNDATLTSPMNEKFCYKCHDGNGTTDIYGETMSTASKNVYNEFSSSVSKHDITGATGAQLTCINCHNQHNTSKNPLNSGLSNSDLSDPSNTLNPFTTASGNLADFCLKCHGPLVPSAVNDGSTYVPSNVVFQSVSFTNPAAGWNKATFTSSGHYSSSVYCDSCHNSHGSNYARLLNKPEDTSTTDGVCLSCHNGSVAGATNVKTDLTTGADSTYRHPTLDSSGLHSDTESFPSTTANRHASCVDCHDPHAANNSAASAGKVSGKIANVLGVTPSYPSSNTTFAGATSYSTGTAGYEYQLCFKCHTNFNGNYPTPPSGAIAETDLAQEFNPVNPSFHDVGMYTGTARSYVGSFKSGTNMDGNTVIYCSSCHGANTNNSTLTATSGPVHGSANQYILKGTWNASTTVSTANNLCLKCHDNTNGSSRFTDGTNNLHASTGHSAASCEACHSEVPHGGKRPSLIVVAPGSASSNKTEYAYDANYDGVYGKNSKLVLNTWKNNGNWSFTDCSGCH